MIPGITASVQGGAGPGPTTDPFWAFVVSLIQGADGLVDAKGNSLSIRGSGSFVDGKFVTAKDTFDGLAISGAGDIFEFPDDFCIELFTEGSPTNTNYQMMYGSTDNGSVPNSIYAEYATNRNAYFLLGSIGGINTSSPPDGAEHFFVLARQSGTVGVAIDGAWINTFASGATVINPTGEMVIGNYASGAFAAAGSNKYRGWRVTKGHSRYDIGTPFSTPPLPYPEA